MLNEERPLYRAVFKLNQEDENHKFRPLPKPSGKYPYRLSFAPKVPNRLSFHVVGDTGGLYDTDSRHRVAGAMVKQSETGEKPDFLYHLGDVVYNFGEAYDYSRQFFKPYEAYSAPIFAIAGNHDSDVNMASAEPYESLDAFVKVFCDTEPRQIAFAKGASRRSNIQPNVYWTLDTPLAIIIGMHSNVPKYGIVTDEQRSWLIEELKAADLQRPGKAVLIAIHHAPYSADTNHGSSVPMIELLEGVFRETGIRPDLVMSGHVHNYQRFIKTYPEGKPVTYLVAGAGGYDELHRLAENDDPRYATESPLFNNVELQAYQDDRHGFLNICIEKEKTGLKLTGQYYSLTNPANSLPVLTDTFVLQIV